MTELNLIEEIYKKRSEVVSLKMSLHARQLDKTHEVKKARRELARLLTQLNKGK